MIGGSLMTLFCWQKGRQKADYKKMLLATARWPVPFDVFLLRFDEGSEIPLHIDQVKKGYHHRINIVLKHGKQGGQFICENPIFESKRVKYFRPDISAHQVTKITKGIRYVLSIGWIRAS